MAKLDFFGKHKRRIWEQLAEQLDGDFFRGGMTKSARVEAFYENWLIVFDQYMVDKVTYTRVRAPYINRDDFIFKIQREHLGHRIQKAFGMQDVIVGEPEFDREFVIQGSDERKLKMMFANPHIRDLVSYQPKILLELKREAPLFTKPKFPKDVNELHFRVAKVIRNLDRFHDLYELFAHTLDHLCAIGTAYEDDPNFRYYK
ncbi:MAG: DUF3137 domain-containing protein [Bacteroidota bacterium]